MRSERKAKSEDESGYSRLQWDNIGLEGYSGSDKSMLCITSGFCQRRGAAKLGAGASEESNLDEWAWVVMFTVYKYQPRTGARSLIFRGRTICISQSGAVLPFRRQRD